MAQRTNCTEQAFPTNETSLAAATRSDFAAITLYVPETTTRTFRSVAVQITCRDNSATAQDLTSWLIGIKLGAVAFDDATVTNTIAHSSEHQTHTFTRDVTSYFATNFGAGATQTCQVGVQFGGSVTINITAKLIITYEYDDASQTTRIKTVRIPLESATGALTTTLTEIGTNQVPLLDTFLPESTKVFRDIFFEVMGNEANAGVTNTNLSLALDAEAADNTGVIENALASSCWFYYIWQRLAMTTNVTHAFNLATVSTTGSTFNHMAIVLVVTYEYDHSASTTILNSVMLPVYFSGTRGGSAAADQDRYERKFFIEEPTTIALVQSGVLLYWGTTSAFNINVLCGSQAARTYTVVGGTVAGMHNVMQRIDSGGAQGAGITLARGENTLTANYYFASAIDLGGASGWCYLNYTSGKASAGAAVHNHTIFHLIGGQIAAAAKRAFTATAPNIPEADYYAMTALCLQYLWGSPGNSQAIEAEVLSGEGAGDGWRILYNKFLQWDVENGVATGVGPPIDEFDRYPQDQRALGLVLESSRVYQRQSVGNTWDALAMWITYHAISYDIAGAVTPNPGAGVAVQAYRTDTKEYLNTANTDVSGNYTMKWYDNVIEVFTECRQSSSEVGRSDNGVAA